MADGQPLYDLSPVLFILAAGAMLAIIPIAWIWLRDRQATRSARLRKLTLLTLFLTFDLVLFGAFTRLTDSGLGCPDWPGCYGSASPLGAHAEIAEAQSAMPTGPVTHGKAWVEMVHRYLATGVGALITLLMVMSWRWRRDIAVSPWWPTLTFLWVCLQGAFGALTVTMKLFPAIVTMHLLGGLVLLALLRAQTASAADRVTQGLKPSGRDANGWGKSWPVLALFALVWLQIALGGWVSTNYAVLACSEFPMCQGSWWPTMDFDAGFTLWRHLGVDELGQAIPFAALTAIHYVHRLMAYVVLAALVASAWYHWQRPEHRGLARALGILAVWQLLSGLSNVVLDWPLISAVAHTGGAAALIVVLTGALADRRQQPTVHAAAQPRGMARATG